MKTENLQATGLMMEKAKDGAQELKQVSDVTTVSVFTDILLHRVVKTESGTILFHLAKVNEFVDFLIKDFKIEDSIFKLIFISQ